MANKPTRYSEVTPLQKKRFTIFLVVFISGFLLLSLIGTSINQDGFVVLSFLAPLVILTGIVGIAWSLYRVPSAQNESISRHSKPNGSRSSKK